MTDGESTGVLVWWGALAAVSVLNVCAWATVVTRTRPGGATRPDDRMVRRWLTWLSAMFVFGCAFRSFLPRAEGQRICLYDSWISSAMIARSVATLAELSLVAEWSIVLSIWAREDNARRVGWIALTLVPLIAVAEICSWYTTLTTNFFGSVIEESIWAGTATLMTLSLIWFWPRAPAGRRRFIGIAILLNVAYVFFMCSVDVPMYLARWRRDQAYGKTYLTVVDGVRDSQVRRVVTRRWEDWRDEMPWMSLYFSAGVWISISLVRAPLRAGALADADRQRSLPAPV